MTHLLCTCYQSLTCEAMKTIKVLLVAAVCGLVTSRPTEILNYDAETHSRSESGDPGVAVKGEYRFLNDGKEYKVVYVADDDGFRAQGDHIPSTGELGASSSEGAKSPDLKVVTTKAPASKILSDSVEILRYTTDDHSRVETGQPGVAVQGEYTYKDGDKEFKVTYVADDQGFRTQDAQPFASNNFQTQPSKAQSNTLQKTASAQSEILKYDAETHSRLETGQPGVAVQGEYKYVNDGKEFKVSYVADDDGFRAQGDHTPVAGELGASSSEGAKSPARRVTTTRPPAIKTLSAPIEILRYTADDHSRVETGQPGVAVQGEYTYSSEGKDFKVSYVADDEGFRAIGDHIPLAPSPSQSKEVASSETKTSAEPLQKTVAVPGEILNYDAETHSRLETGVPGVAVKGEYKFINDGKEYHVMYVADEDGFRPQGMRIANVPEFSSKTSNAAGYETPTETLKKTAPSSAVILSYDAETHSRLETGEPGVAVQGEYKYTNDGKDYKVTYIADDEGFRAEGDHIPLAPQLVKTLQKSESQAPVVSTVETSASSGEILNYDAETHSRLETGEPGVAVKGEYKFVNDGKEYKITYIADDQGFRAEGDILPSAADSVGSIATTNTEKLSPVVADDKLVAAPSVAVEDEKLNQKVEPEQPLKEMSSGPNSITVVADSATAIQAKTGADCDTPARAAPVQPTFFIPVHLPYGHPFGYYIVHVKK